jgi:hypothetical protein
LKQMSGMGLKSNHSRLFPCLLQFTLIKHITIWATESADKLSPFKDWISSMYQNSRSRNISIGIATCYGLDGWGSILGKGKWYFSIPRRPDRFAGLSSLLPNGYRGLLQPGVKLPGHGADHSPPCSAHVKNDGAVLTLPHTPSEPGP